MIKCFELALYQSHKSRMKKKWCPEIHISLCGYILVFDFLLDFSILNILCNKRKREEAGYIFIHKHCLFFPVYNKGI